MDSPDGTQGSIQTISGQHWAKYAGTVLHVTFTWPPGPDEYLAAQQKLVRCLREVTNHDICEIPL